MEIFGGVDSLSNHLTVNHNAMIIQGWCFSNPPSEIKVEISFDGNVLDIARWGLPRFDIFKKFGTEESYESGFTSRVSLSSLNYGDHKLKIIAKINGIKKDLKEISINKQLRFGLKNGINKVLKEISINKQLRFGLESIPLTPAGEIGSFKKIGESFIKKFIEFCNLKSDNLVLDVGCGMGRMALPLARFLNEKGQYYGLDTIKFATDYCNRNISRRFPNFHFENVDIYNQLYNARSTAKASNYVFPFDDNKFDFVFLISVFTHMLPSDMSNYLHQIYRVLKKDSRCFMTFFISNELKLQNPNFCSFFKYQHEEYRLKNEKVPEAAISYEENYLKRLFSKKGFTILEPIHYEKWPNQDYIIVKK